MTQLNLSVRSHAQITPAQQLNERFAATYTPAPTGFRTTTLATRPGDSDPDMDEALRRVRQGGKPPAPRADSGDWDDNRPVVPRIPRPRTPGSTPVAAPARPTTVRHANGLEFKVIPADSPFARIARSIRQLEMDDGTVWTVGAPIGWRAAGAAWRPEPPRGQTFDDDSDDVCPICECWTCTCGSSRAASTPTCPRCRLIFEACTCIGVTALALAGERR
ncbi:hypothetical protein ABZ439_11465 [Streptomyces sp. NPDC005840]|uniref:hypothetical protein n=1 Tax=Streptomyces sp. NPDC005840 TaxID=3157072 RepID=UPI0033C7E807